MPLLQGAEANMGKKFLNTIFLVWLVQFVKKQ